MNQLHLPREFSGTPVLWSPQVASPLRMAIVEPGWTLSEIIAATPNLPLGFAEIGVARIGGHIIPRQNWHRVRPLAGTPRAVVTLEIDLQGGGRNVFGIIASLALMLITPFLAPALAGAVLGPEIATTAFAFRATTAFISLTLATAGALAIRAVSPPPALAALEPPIGDTPQPAGNASISGNTLGMAQPIPACIGDGVRVVPPLASQVLVESIGNDQFAEAAFVLAGPHQITEPWVGKTKLSEMPDIEYEVFDAQPGSAPPTLLRRYGSTESVQIEMSRHQVDETNDGVTFQLKDQEHPDNSIPKFHTVTSKTAPDEIWVLADFPQGLSDMSVLVLSGGVTPPTQAVPFRIQLRKRHDDSYIKLPEIHVASTKGTPFRITFKFLFKKGPIADPYPKAPVNEGVYLAHKHVPAQTIYPPSEDWVADNYFSAGSGGNAYYYGSQDTHNVRNVSLYQDRVEFFLDPDVFEPGAYEIQIKQGMSYTYYDLIGTVENYIFNADVNPTVYDFFTYYQDAESLKYRLIRRRAGLNDRVMLTTIASVKNEHPVQTDKIAIMSVRVKNQQLEQFSVIGALLVPDWTGTEWSGYNVSSNPAVHLRNVLCGEQALRPIEPTSINDDEILVFRQRCIDQSFRVNGVVQGQNRRAVCDLIAGTGYARLREAEKVGVTLDYDRSAESPVLPLSPLTMSDFAWRKAFPALPSGYLVNIKNKDNDFNDYEFLVMRPGAVDDGIYERVTYDLIDNITDATARATFDLRSLSERMTFYTCKVGPGNLIAPRGAMLGVSHDILIRQASWARVLSVISSGGTIYGLVLINPISTLGEDAFSEISDAFSSYSSGFESARYGIMLERRDGTVSVHEIDVTEDYPTTIMFTTPFADPGDDAKGNPIIGEDCNVYAGPLGQEYLRLIMTAVQPNADKTANITMVDEAPPLWAEDGSVNLAA